MTTRTLRTTLDTLWQASAPLTAVGLGMLALTPLALLAMAIDPRAIAGAPAWLKPAKFAVSTGIFSLTMAWMFLYLPGRPRLRRIAGWTTALVFVVEVGIIGAQAWRGTTSHFNVGTLLDGVLFSVMGAAIVLQTVMTVGVALALWRTRFEDRALGWALRFGLTLSILGASVGGLMTRPTEAQLADLRGGRGMAVAGAHTVGAPDGGPGMAGTGWSLEHGDLRVPHFVGLHAMQALPLLLLFLRGRIGEAARSRAAVVAAASYASLFGILLWEALRGISIVAPDAQAGVTMAAWSAATLAALLWLLGVCASQITTGRAVVAAEKPRSRLVVPGTLPVDTPPEFRAGPASPR